jgi:hypothetical protein
MDYASVDDGKAAGGLRLALTGGVPGPWSEAAKGMFRVRSVDYLPVFQEGGGANEALVAWTGHRNAPTAMYNDEPARVTPVDMINLAERLGTGPSLVPADIEERVTMFGLLNEIAGENGFGWSARILMFAAMVASLGEAAMKDNPMLRDYHYDPAEAAGVPGRLIAILECLTRQLTAQSEAGSRYFVGDTLSALDIYWACFSQMLAPLPPEVNPMPEYLYGIWGQTAKSLEGVGYQPDPALLEHRDYIFPTYLQWPLDF